MFLSTNGGLVLALAVGDLRIEESVGTGFSAIKTLLRRHGFSGENKLDRFVFVEKFQNVF
jgi:hypothetical protein